MLCIPHVGGQRRFASCPPHGHDQNSPEMQDSECFAFLMWAVRDASRLARPMDMIKIRLKCKHFILILIMSMGC